jgi:hypothetical protein
MDWQNDEDRLILDISMGLKKHRYAPPRKTHDCAERDRYYLSVASEVVRQLKLSWFFTPQRNAARP